jgi:hypothetical protein
MTILIGLVMVYFISVGFSGKYRDKYAAEKEKNVLLRERLVTMTSVYEQQMLKLYAEQKERL